MLWGITSYFNPVGFQRPLQNLQRFAENARAQGLPLMIVELALEGAEFVIDESWCDLLVRVRSDEVLFHKEALINIGLNHLPASCDTVAWLDSDVLFENQQWVAETREALERHQVVQPFSHCVWLPADVESVDVALTTYPSHATEYGRIHSFGFGWHHFGPQALEARVIYGHVGFAWAARRAVLDEIGLYDASILGSGDNLMAHAFVGPEVMVRTDGLRIAPGVLAHFGEWAQRANAAVHGDVGYVDGTLNHLWHGKMSNRGYVERNRVLLTHGFDPRLHLQRDDSGLYRLHNAPPLLEAAVRKHFADRQEDLVPAHSPVCKFGEGFHNDEGTFRWAQKRASAQVLRHTADWSITVSTNAPHRLAGPQRITASINGAQVATAELADSNKVEMHLGQVQPGDELELQAEHMIRPSEFGGKDQRELAFMLWTS